jgi:hypothetical protein
MRILTLGDSWTYGENSSDPKTMSWPAQLSRKHKVEVVNLARKGSSNQRAARIGIEELCRDNNYDYVIFPLAPAPRTEILKIGKWHQIWPGRHASNNVDKIYTDFWHPWNDLQQTIMLSFYFIHSVKSLGIPLYVTGLSLYPSQYSYELSWIMNYENNDNFSNLKISEEILSTISTKDFDRKLKSLKAIHLKNLDSQPEYLDDIVKSYLFDSKTQAQYSYNYKSFNGHPNDRGYSALADYFAGKIGLI